MDKIEKVARALATYELAMGDAPAIVKSVVDANWKDYVGIARVVVAALESEDNTPKTQ